jgi:hypothetical protein
MSSIRKLKGESGHFAEMDFFAPIIVLAVTAAILVPYLLRWRDEVRNISCLETLARVANQEIGLGDASCRIPNMEVEREKVVAVERYFLSGSESWYPTSPVFLRNEANLTFEQDFPSVEMVPDDGASLPRTRPASRDAGCGGLFGSST